LPERFLRNRSFKIRKTPPSAGFFCIDGKIVNNIDNRLKILAVSKATMNLDNRVKDGGFDWIHAGQQVLNSSYTRPLTKRNRRSQIHILEAIAGAWLAMAATTASAEPLQAKLQEFKAFARDFRLKNTVLSMSYAIAKDGKIIAAEGFGWQDHDAEEPTTTDTTYLVASITKTFSAATLLAMDADGIIDLDDDFTKLSDWDDRCQWLSTSGLIFGGGVKLDDGYTPPKLDCSAKITLRNVLQMRVLGKPGSNFLYNPVVYGRLANWVEEQTGKPYAYWVRRYIIDKAGLKNVAAGWRDPDGGDALRLLAPPFRHAPEQEDNLAPSPLPNPEMNASSGIIASTRSLALYSIALDEGRILTPELRNAMWTQPREADGRPASYAYGWWVQQWNGQKLVWHGGWWPDAYAGFLLKVPDKHLTLVAYGNTDGLHWGNRLEVAEIEKSPFAAKFLDLFASE
jgi:CubicO group peptidase (beta-lactamase class C family)